MTDQSDTNVPRMTTDVKRADFLPPVHASACRRDDPYVVFTYEEHGRRMVETHRTASKALHAVAVLNDHAKATGGATSGFALAPTE